MRIFLYRTSLFLSASTQKGTIDRRRSSRSKSSKRFSPVDLNKGIFSKKHTTSTERLAKQSLSRRISNDWREEGSSPSPCPRTSGDFSNIITTSTHNVSRATPITSQRVIENETYIQPWRKYMRELGKNEEVLKN